MSSSVFQEKQEKVVLRKFTKKCGFDPQSKSLFYAPDFKGATSPLFELFFGSFKIVFNWKETFK